MSKGSSKEIVLRWSDRNGTWNRKLFETTSRFGGHTPVLDGFLPEIAWHDVFFRVEHVPVAAIIPLAELGIAKPERLNELPSVRVAAKPFPEQEMSVLPTEVGQAIIRADEHVHVFKLVAKDNVLVTNLQWAQAALAMWYRFDRGLQLDGVAAGISGRFPTGFLLDACSWKSGAQVKMTFGPSDTLAYERAQTQMPTLDIVARNSYDQSVALTLSPAFRVTSSEQWFRESLPFVSDSELAELSRAERKRGVEHFIPSKLVLKLTGQERTALVRAYFRELELPLQEVGKDMRSDGVGELLALCAGYTAHFRPRSRWADEPEADSMMEPDDPKPIESAKKLEVQRTLTGAMEVVNTFTYYLRGLANYSLGAAHKLPLFTAVLHRKDVVLSNGDVTETEYRRLMNMKPFWRSWNGMRMWHHSISNGSATADTALEALFVMVVHREHLQELFGLNAAEFDSRLDDFAEKFGSIKPQRVTQYVKGFERLSQIYFGRVL